MTSESQGRAIYVWAWLPGAGTPVVAGRLTLVALGGQTMGSFVYGKSYLGNRAAKALDPVALPLAERAFEFSALSGVPSAILDAAPDAWGRKVIDKLSRNEGGDRHLFDYLLLANDTTGNLGFSTGASTPPRADAGLALAPVPLDTLLAAIDAIEANAPIDRIEGVNDALLVALLNGTGGARPKAAVSVEGQRWIAKFPSAADTFQVSNPRLEQISLQLAAQCGIRVAQSRLERVAGRDVLLVKRFDRDVSTTKNIDDAANGAGNEVVHGSVAFSGRGEAARVHKKSVLSFRTVFCADPQTQAVSLGGSYARAARQLTRYCADAQSERAELFQRLCFNVAIGNTDDHELNHALVFGAGELANGYTLSPAYDIVPTLANTLRRIHALQIGDGFEGTRANILASCEAFGIGEDEGASLLVHTVKTIDAMWRDVAYVNGLDDRDCNAIERLFSAAAIEARLSQNTGLAPAPSRL